MYDQILRDVSSDAFYQQQFPNDGQRFVAWYLRNIHQRDKNQTRDDITDGPDDKQIDAIYIDDNAQSVYIIQGKFIGNKLVDAAPLREVIAAWVQIKDLINLQTVGNNKLKRKLSELSTALDDGYEVHFELITTANLTDAAENDLVLFQDQLVKLSDSTDINASLHLVDQDELRRRYDMALEIVNPTINYTLDLTKCKVMPLIANNTNVIIAVVPLAECLRLPGVKDGTLFRKNVRQSLGLSNSVNKGIKNTIMGEKHKDFFFFHNGITAICSKMELSDSQLSLKGLSVVNGCQSLNTILTCSEKIKTLEDTSVLFRFYEIPQIDRADRISINTNSQSSVKPRDLRSNDKRVLNIKRLYEMRYSTGFFATKRGEQIPADKDKNYCVDLAEFGKYLMSWHSQRPNVAYSETKIFDKFFEQLFKREYQPEDVFALNWWMNKILKTWVSDNPLGLNESLLAMKAYAPYHQLYAISMCYAIINNQSDKVPNPFACYTAVEQSILADKIVEIAGQSLNMALETAANTPTTDNRVFSPQNWIKAKTCLAGINAAIRSYFGLLPMMPGGAEIKAKMEAGMKLDPKDFEYRWSAD